jgi:hypothetical protein
MTREDIIRMAREAEKLWVQHGDENDSNRFLEIFTALVIAHREAQSIHSCGPDCQKPLCVNRRREIAAAVEAEREACKKLAQEHAAEYRVGGRLYAPLGENYALCAATACDHIVHLIEERGSK